MFDRRVLERVCQDLEKAMLANQSLTGKVSIMVETAEDEAVVVGTSGALLKLACAIINHVRSVGEEDSLNQTAFGVCDVNSSSVPKGIFDSLAHIVPGSIIVVQTEEDRIEICSTLHDL